ncbi:MAG: glycosyltransferase [Planctomycetota bacterium]
MKLSCLINSHNYIDYVGEAIDSALAQELPFDEVIVVDDGSTDGSAQWLQQTYQENPQVQVIAKPQAGQLSCFHRGIEGASGDVVFFLDADDRFHPTMTLRAADIYQSHGHVDFLSVGFEEFGGDHRGRRQQTRTRDRGLSVLGVLLHRLWIGNPTSCLSMRSDLCRRILPFPFESEWITRADDVLIFGASLLAGHKYHLEEPLVEYRIHDSNHHARRKLRQSDKLQYAYRVNRMIGWYVREMGYDREALAYLLPREFRTIEKPNWREFRQYCRMTSRARLPLLTRIEQVAAMAAHYAKERRK